MVAGPMEMWRWWIDGLVDTVQLVSDRLRRRRPVRLAARDGGWAIEHAGGRIGRGLRLTDAAGLLRRPLARALAGRSVDLVISPSEVVTRRLGPLPPESRPFLDGIVAHQLERMTPWLATDTLASHRVEMVAPDDPRLTVVVDATSRALHRDVVAALEAAGPKELRLVRPATGSEAEAVLPVATADHGVVRRRIGNRVMAGLAATLVVAATAGWWLWDRAATLDDEIAEIEDRIDSFQRRLAPAAGAAASDRDLIAALSRETPMSVIALEDLSAALPDDTHLTGLQIARGRVRMTGITHDIAGLTAAVEAAHGFADPVFSAPTVRLAEGDKFTLDLGVAGSGEKRR